LVLEMLVVFVEFVLFLLGIDVHVVLVVVGKAFRVGLGVISCDDCFVVCCVGCFLIIGGCLFAALCGYRPVQVAA
jgi:hypothetical protein